VAAAAVHPAVLVATAVTVADKQLVVAVYVDVETELPESVYNGSAI